MVDFWGKKDGRESGRFWRYRKEIGGVVKRGVGFRVELFLIN